MKEVSKSILYNDMVISAENVQKMGEVTALTCIKTVIALSGKDLRYEPLKRRLFAVFKRIRYCARGNVVSLPTYR